MNIEKLNLILGSTDKFKEIWIESENGSSLCALISDDIGWLMYLRHEGDTGFSSRNPNDNSTMEIEYKLSNGQMDHYPKNWAFPLDVIRGALVSFLTSGNKPHQVSWHDDSK